MAEQGLGLEERTDWLLRKSAALLQGGPAPFRRGPAPLRAGPAPSSDPAPSGDPLVQWRLRRRAEETPRAPPCWTSRDPPRWTPAPCSRDTEEASHLRGSRDPAGEAQPIGRGSEVPWAPPCWTSRDLKEVSRDVSRPMREAPIEPPARSRDPQDAPQPIRSGSQELPWGPPCWTSRDLCEVSRDALRPMREDPHVHPARSRDPQEAPQPIRSGSQDALQPPEDDSKAPLDPILRLLRRRRHRLWQSLRAVDSALASLPH